MEFSFKSITLFCAVLLTGLSDGLFCAWMISVIPGTRKVSDLTYLEAMQSINREILNPAFILIFFGSPILLTVCAIQNFRTGLSFWLILAATVTYLTGTVGVTVLGNVPLNNSLDALQLEKLTRVQMTDFRREYELNWNKLHAVRTVFALISFLLTVSGVFYFSKSL